MQRNRARLTGALIVAAAAIFLAPASPLSAQVNMTGTWVMTVDVDGAISNPEITLEQDGMALTGSYVSATLGEADVTGTVDGNTVTVMFEANVQGQTLPGEYTGTVDSDGVWTGTFDLSGLAGGPFTATKQ
jgi:hypothetical protein